MNKIILALAAAAVLVPGGYGLYRIGVKQGRALPSASSDRVTSPNDKKILYWHDPMVPGQKFDHPGKSPFMDMALVPVYADNADIAGGASDVGSVSKVTISPRVQQNLGIRTADVMRGKLSGVIETVGSIAWNESDVALVQARSNGFVERLYVRAPLDAVHKGQALAELYVPEWVAAQEEYLSVKRMQGAGVDIGTSLLDAARQRMRLVGMSDAQIGLVEATGKAYARLTVTAPISGVIAELGAREGMTVMAGAALFRINGLGTVWVNAEIPENSAAAIRPGTVVQAHAPALPGIILGGKVSAILPEINPVTHTLKARIEFANPGARLVPGMFVAVTFSAAVGKDVLLVPSEAVIQTGSRSVVMLAQPEGHFLPVEVELGAEAHGQSEILHGLQAGQKVVISGQFLIDSEASLKATLTRMGGMAPPVSAPAIGKAGQAASTPPSPLHHGVGKVEQIDEDKITLSHGPIPTLHWGAMTMGFKLPLNGLPVDVAVGDTVLFEIRQTPDGSYRIASIARQAKDIK